MNGITDGSDNSKMITSAFSTNGKYGGLIKPKGSKVIRNMLGNMLLYIDTFIPNYYIMHSMISFFRLLQYTGLFFSTGSTLLWPVGSKERNALGYISILWNIIPSEFRDICSVPFLFIYSILFIGFIITILAISKYYIKTSKIPKGFAEGLTIFISIPGYLLHNPALEIAGETIGRLITGEASEYSIALYIVSVVLAMISFLSYYFFYRQVYGVSLIFRSTSLICINGYTQIKMFFAFATASILIGLASMLPRIPQSVLSVIASLGYLSLIYTVLTVYSIIKPLHKVAIMTISIAGFIIQLVIAILIGIGQHGNIILFLVFILIIVLSYFASHLSYNVYTTKLINLLDNILEDASIMKEEKYYHKLLNASIGGMYMAHPASIDFSVFRFLSQQWPDEIIIWTTFAKFVAIYPEENSLLTFIMRSIIQHKFHGIIAKQTIAQALSVLKQREIYYTNEIKMKTDKAAKQIVGVKRRLRRIWDQVIQGNMNEMEGSLINAYKSVVRCDAELERLLTEFPNNRFVARLYSRYINDIRADFDSYVEWLEKVKMLQRGSLVNTDRARELGLHEFPSLPITTRISNDCAAINTTIESSSNIVDPEAEEEAAIQRREHTALIKDMLADLKIPSLVCTRVTSVIIVVVTCIIAIAISALFNLMVSMLTEPLSIMQHVSYLTPAAARISSLIQHYVLENSIDTDGKTLVSIPDFGSNYPSDYSTLKDLLETAKDTQVHVQTVSEFRTTTTIFSPNLFKKVRDKLFSNTFTYTSVTSSDPYNTSIINAFADIFVQVMAVSELNFSLSSQPDFFNQACLINPLMNMLSISDFLVDYNDDLGNYIIQASESVQTIMNILMYSLLIFLVVGMIVVIVAEIIFIKSNKRALYRCLMSLPKNVVSQISEYLRVIKKSDDSNTTKTEMDTTGENNRQEENVIKVFMTATDSSDNAISGIAALILADLGMLAGLVILVITACLTYSQLSYINKTNGVHIGTLLGSSGRMMCMASMMNNIIGMSSDEKYNFMKIKKEDIKDEMDVLQLSFAELYISARFGDLEKGYKPLQTLNEIVEITMKENTCNPSEVPTSLREIYSCFPPDFQIRNASPLLHKVIYPYTEEGKKVKASALSAEVYYISMYQLWNGFYTISFNDIKPLILNLMNQMTPICIGLMFAVIFIELICLIVALRAVKSGEDRLYFALNMLKNCPTANVLSNQSIMRLLSGNFSNKGNDAANRSTEFFNAIVKELPDSVIIAETSNGVVSSQNKNTETIYQVDLINKKLTDFFTEAAFSKELADLVAAPSKHKKKVECHHHLPSDEEVFLEITVVIIGSNIAVTTRNITQTYQYNKLIHEEQVKSDQLLMSILPPMMVPRVQSGEKNISFSVQSVSVVFIDIVEFTPWCASNTAQVVTSTLNMMFREFDSIINSLSTMTKIKCIGDCYMAAGGIFSEVSNPGMNAKEAVDFGLQAIQAIVKLNEAINQNLKIRVGINVGGPIVAGVLGTEKPTFEILGPAINMAQQMEHHGVPMAVHISRTVYELIYGGSFNIQERGQIDIKNGKAVTYLVK